MVLDHLHLAVVVEGTTEAVVACTIGEAGVDQAMSMLLLSSCTIRKACGEAMESFTSHLLTHPRASHPTIPQANQQPVQPKYSRALLVCIRRLPH